MSGQTMTDDRLLALIEAYGADPDLFPERERDAARAHLAANPGRFAAALEAAHRMDELFGGLPDIVTPDPLRSALIASAPKPAAAKRPAWKLPAWIPAGALASLAVGVFAGFSMAQPVTTQDESAEALVYASLGFDTYALELEEGTTQ